MSVASDDEEWQTVPHSMKRKLPSPSSIPRKLQTLDNTNTYEILSTDDDNIMDDEEAEEDEQIPPPTPAPAKTPPIIIPGVRNIAAMIKKFSRVISPTTFHFKTLSDGQIRVMTDNTDSYRTLVSYLKSAKIMFHKYQLKESRAFRFVIKNLHYSTPTDEIIKEIETYDHKVRNITNIRCRFTKNPLSMFFVDIEPSHNNKDVYLIKHIGNAIVKIESPRKRDEIVQCQRCQQYGHTKSYCYKPYKCVKCGLDHLTVECLKNKETPAKCANCSGNHPASYRGCIVYQELVNKKFKTRQNRYPKSTVQNNVLFSNNHQSQHNSNNTCPNDPSYASVLKGKENQTENNSFKKIEDLLHKQIELTNNLFSMITLLINKLCSQK